MNCLPFLGHEKWEAFYASRLEGEARHRGQEGGDRALRARPRLQVCGEGAVGPARNRETMALRYTGRSEARCCYPWTASRRGTHTSRRSPRPRAVVDGGMTKAEAMAAFGIMSMTPLETVVRAIPRGRRGGAQARGPRAGRAVPGRGRARTREEELEERCRRLETEVAYLKKLRALVERDGL